MEGAGAICVGCGRMRPHFETGIDGEGRAHVFGPSARGESEGIRSMGSLPRFSPAQPGTQLEDLADTRGVLAWKEVEGDKTVKARLLAKGFRGPDLRMGNVNMAGCVSRRSSQLQVIFLGAPTKWPLWSLDIKNASFHADGFDWEIYPQAPSEWNSKESRLVRKLRAPVDGLHDAPRGLPLIPAQIRSELRGIAVLRGTAF